MSSASFRSRIVVDTFERLSGVPEGLRALGLEVEFMTLPIGDYDLGSGVLVERKTTADLHLSLERGRLWSQVGRLRHHARSPYLLVKGGSLDADSISPGAIRGACLAVVGQGVALIRSEGPSDTALWLGVLARRRARLRLGRDRPAYAQRLKRPAELAPEAMLAAIPGISVVGARALLTRFGTVSGVVSATEREWCEVPGIGARRAAALRSAIF